MKRKIVSDIYRKRQDIILPFLLKKLKKYASILKEFDLLFFNIILTFLKGKSMKVENLTRKKFVSKYHIQCVKILRTLLKGEVRGPLDQANKENLLKAIKLVNSMIVGDKFLSDIPIGKKVGNILRNKIELAKIGIDAVDDLIRDLEYESYPYHIFFERVLKQLKRVKKGKKANFGLMTSFFDRLKTKFYFSSR